jgi:hypothetical protein
MAQRNLITVSAFVTSWGHILAQIYTLETDASFTIQGYYASMNITNNFALKMTDIIAE